MVARDKVRVFGSELMVTDEIGGREIAAILKPGCVKYKGSSVLANFALNAQYVVARVTEFPLPESFDAPKVETDEIVVGGFITGRQANRLLPKGSQIRFAAGENNPVLVKMDDRTDDAAWSGHGGDAWGIDRSGLWQIVAIGTDEPMQTVGEFQDFLGNIIVSMGADEVTVNTNESASGPVGEFTEDENDESVPTGKCGVCGEGVELTKKNRMKVHEFAGGKCLGSGGKSA